MLLREVPLNASVESEDEARLSEQHTPVIMRLINGEPPTGKELQDIAFNHTARISEIRAALKKIGLKLPAKNLGGGLWQYSIEDKNGKRQVGNWIIERLNQVSKKPILWD